MLFCTIMTELRKKRGWSLRETAEKTGITEFTLAQVEKRYKLLGPYYVMRIADVFEVPFAELAIKNSIIDEYEDADKVRRVFEILDMEPDSWMHIRKVDHLTEDEVIKMKNYHLKIIKEYEKKVD
jgi:transcriptional regulator with XRE-family HTH domain